jgi:hypothetical protein
VASVHFQRGEKAPAFSPIVTVSPDSPTFVQGFVHELQQTSVKPGTEVEIHSLTNPAAAVMGKVISVGSRYVEIPVRLAPSPLKADSSGVWGREVTVEIPPGSQIILGEKVQISPYHPLLQSFVARAEEEESPAAKALKPVRIPPALADSTNFEASGAVYLKDLDKYLVVSDDTDNRDSPWIFLMGEDGEVEERPLEIPGISAMKDMESISADGGYIYVMSSLTSRHKGGVDLARNMLVRFKREGRKLSEAQSVPFGSILRRLIAGSRHPTLKGLMSEGLKKLEVESQSVRDGALYIGLKAPSYPGSTSTLILRLPDVNALFAGKAGEQELEVWKNFRLDLNDMPLQRLTDITFVGTNLYFTTSCKGEDCGAVWKIGENESTPHLIQTHKHHNPEGIAYNAEKNLFLVTFDMGNNGSEFTTIAGPRSKRN